MASLGGIVKYRMGTKPKSLVLDNVPTDANIPEDGLTLLYGFSTNSLSELQRVISEGEKVGERVDMVRIEMAGGDFTNLTPERLPNARILNLQSISAALGKEIKAAWRKILKEDGVEIESLPDDYFTATNYAIHDPQYFTELRKQEQFKHLDAICYPYLPPGSKIMSNRITLFNYDRILSVTNTVDPSITIELPRLAVKQAKRHAPA